MRAKIIETGKGRYGILGEFEIGNSGAWEQRVLISGVSLKKAQKLIKKVI
jgi:hypothetical protein